MDPQKATVRRYFETLRHLEPEQLRYQLWRPLQPYLWPRPRRLPQHVAVRPEWGMQVRRPRRPADPRVLEGVFRFWGIERQLDMEREWIAEDLGSSWNFPVHYFDQVASLASAEDLPAGRADSIRDQMSQWMEQHHVERGDPWHPYTTSLRVVNWLDVIASLHATSETEWTDTVLQSVYRRPFNI